VQPIVTEYATVFQNNITPLNLHPEHALLKARRATLCPLLSQLDVLLYIAVGSLHGLRSFD
jgi:hypothetical protein